MKLSNTFVTAASCWTVDDYLNVWTPMSPTSSWQQRGNERRISDSL